MTLHPQAAFRAVHRPLYPTMNSVQEVLDLADSKIPLTSKNDLFILLMTMQNTILKTLHDQQQLTH